MLLPKRTALTLHALPQATRRVSTTAARPMATPTNRVSPNDPRGNNPVDDIDLVFDYPTEGQAAHQRQPLESSGLDLHSAMPHRSKAGMATQAAQAVPGAQRMAKEMGPSDSNAMYRYIGLGALGLGGLYMMMRRQSASVGGTVMTQPGDLAAQKPGETGSMARVLKRG